MSVPVSAASGNTPSAGALEAPGSSFTSGSWVNRRRSQVAKQLRGVVHVAEESTDFSRRRDLGVRRYLTVVLAPGTAISGIRGGPQ